jgi:putative SOS response-associated peptidase YedK
MCGRFTIISDPVAFQLEFDLTFAAGVEQNWSPHYNVTPTQFIPVVDNPLERKVDLIQWGLLPIWAKDKKGNFRLINIRAETILEKATFRRLIQKGQRCLILANGFYEWQAPAQTKGPKTPFYFQLKDQKPFAFAGLWDFSSLPDGQTVKTCAIITCAPNQLVSPVHDRMPVILRPEPAWEWLSSQPIPQLLSLLQPFSAEEMEAYPVNPLVNNPAIDQPECIQPAMQN